MVYTRKIQNLTGLGFILALVSFLKLPSLFEPYHYGDEGIYQVVGQVLHRGGFLYRDIWDNKPPLLYLFYAVFNGDQFWVRLASLIFALLATTTFYFLAQEIFSKRSKTPLLTTLLFGVLLSLPLLEGNIANAENFMLFPIILAFYLAFKNFPKISNQTLLISGFLLSLAFLFKVVAIFDFSALFLFLTISLWPKIKRIINVSIPLILSFILPIILTALFFATQDTFKEFAATTFSGNIGYVAWGNKFLTPQGLLILKIFALGLFCLVVFRKRKNLNKSQLFIALWLAFSIFNAAFAGRPWTHYLLVSLPSFCLLFGLLIQATKFRPLVATLIIGILFFAGTQFWLYKQTLEYYPNFFSFVFGKKTLAQYFSFWGGHVDRDYQVAQFLSLKTEPSETVFIWGNNAQIYALSQRSPAGRYTVAYHVGFSQQAEKDTIASLVKTKPRFFIVLLPQDDMPPLLFELFRKNYQLAFQSEGFKVYEASF